MPDLHQVIDLGALAESRYRGCRPRSIVVFGADLDVVLDDDPAGSAGS